MTMGLLVSAAATSLIVGILAGRAAPRVWLAATLAGVAAGLASAIRVLSGGGEWEWWSAFRVGGELLHLRLDGISALFLALLCVIAGAGALYASEYWTDASHPSTARAGRRWWNTLVLSMGVVLLASNGLHFLIGWEVFTISAYFLITLDRANPEVRRAGWLYLAVSHVSVLLLFAFFALLQVRTGSWDLGPMRGHAELAPLFWLMLLSFGIKGGVFPLHIWLPTAHANAPSHVSAMMSGVAIKIGIYGLVRFTGWLPTPPGAGWVLAVLGASSAVFGVAFALGQHDLKRLLAYHSVENVGIILIGLGFALVATEQGHPTWGRLALAGGLLHVWNHGLFKGLLFLGAGSILHATGLRNLNDMGGLIHKMPHTAFYFLVGALAISALPPLNGFVSEWLTFQTALQASILKNGVVRSLLPLFAATLALAGALTGMCFVKVFGIAFLGRPREARHAAPDAAGDHGHDAGMMERFGMAWLAAGCFVLGLFPTSFLLMLNRVAVSLTGHGLREGAVQSNWLWLVPVESERASYSPIVFLIVIVGVTLLTFILVHRFYHGRLRYSDAWGCGYSELTARTQDTADAFGQPIRHIFGPLYLMQRHMPGPEDPAPRFSLKIEDRHWYWLYLPVARLAEYVSSKIALLQQGRISIYLLYSFLTLIALLVFVR